MHPWIRILPLFAAACSLTAAEVQVPTLPLGARAPDFELPGVDGKSHRLKDFETARFLIIIFTCNHCPTAQAYEDRIEKLVADYKPKGVSFVAISPNDPKSVRLDELGYTDLSDSFEEMKIRAAHRKYPYPYLYDGETEKVSKSYGPAATPHVFLFDRERKLRYVGRIDDNEREPLVKTRDLRAALDALLAGREPEVKQTKTFGCSIKWAGKGDSVKKYMEKLAAEPVSVGKIDADGLKKLRKNEGDNIRLINFWSLECGPCIIEFPEFITINRMYRHRAFEFVSVAANFPDQEKEVLRFLKKNESSSRNFLFGDTDKYKLVDAFDSSWDAGLPYTVLLAPGGEVLYESRGPMDPLEVKRRIVKALKEDRFK